MALQSFLETSISGADFPVESGQAEACSRFSSPRAAEEQLALSALLQAFIRRSPEALVFFDRNGRILYKSAHGSRLLDRWNRALRGEAVDRGLPGALRDVFGRHGHAVRLEHPFLPAFAASLESTPAGYVLRLMDDRRGARSECFSPQALDALNSLSSSEQRVARLVAEGLRNDQIAGRLSRSVRTVEFQVHCIFRKLGVSNRVQLARLLTQ